MSPRSHRSPMAALAGVGALWAVRHAGSPSVRGWAPPTLPGRVWGRLWARHGGTGRTGVLLLHGLVSTGDVFGAAFDELSLNHRVVVPDLLGFGRSLDESRSTFAVEDHLDALEELAERTDLLGADRIVVGAHSMGSGLALRWAAEHPDLVSSVVCWGAPVQRSTEAARAEIGGSPMARLFALDTRIAQHACALSCRHRAGAGWATAIAQPRLPVPIARAVPLHTWPAYRDAIDHLVIGSDWSCLVGNLDHQRTALTLAWGDRDEVGDRSFGKALLEGLPNATFHLVRGADHQLPLSRPEICIGHLDLDRADDERAVS